MANALLENGPDQASAPQAEASRLPRDANEILTAVLVHRGWDRRDGQVKMVEAIAEAFDTDDFSAIDVAVNAPVGTGKTLAYIVASLAQGGRVVVATSTKSLQEQIIAEELPKLRDDLQAIYGYDLSYGVLKGQGNYACLARVREGLAKLEGGKGSGDDEMFDLDAPDSRDVSALKEIIRRTEEALSDGDVLRYDSEYLLARMTPQGQKQYSATKGCTHKSKKWWSMGEDGELRPSFALGPQYKDHSPEELVEALSHDDHCAYRAAYAQCVRSDVVVLNSSLLVSEIQRDATNEHADILAGCRVLVIDEAHHLSRILAESYSSTTDFERMFTDFKDAAAKVRKRYGDEAGSMMDAVHRDLMDLEDEIIDIDDDESLGVKAHRIAIGKAANAWKEKAVPVLAALKVRAASEKSTEKVNTEGVPKGLAEILRPIDGDEDSAVAQVGMLKGVLQVNANDEFVNEVTIQGRADASDSALVIKQVPVDVTRFRSDVTRRSLCETPLTAGEGAPAGVVLSSGTITKLVPMLVGMKPRSFIDVESPFDSRKAKLYVPSTIPEPSDPSWVSEAWKEMRSAIELMDGRAMILTTSKAKCIEFTELAKRDLVKPAHVDIETGDLIQPREIISQYDGAKREVVARFAADERAVIVGTISLWEGVDVPGTSLSLVIMDKMPFPMPTDAVFAARRKWVEKHKKNAFMEVDVDHASIMLAQGAGRLIRSTGDIGGVMIMDKRIVTKRYGSAAIGLLPADWMMTSDRKAFHEWLRWANPDTREGEMPKTSDPEVWRAIRQPKRTTRKRLAHD